MLQFEERTIHSIFFFFPPCSSWNQLRDSGIRQMEIKTAHRILIKFKLEKLSFSLLALWACSDYILKLILPSQFQLGLGLTRLFHGVLSLHSFKESEAGSTFSSCKCTRERENRAVSHLSILSSQSHPSRVTLPLVIKTDSKDRGRSVFYCTGRIFLLELKIIVITITSRVFFLTYPYLE